MTSNDRGSSVKCLSVRQPWAWAIASAGKTIENRTRQTKHRGLLAIHAGKAVDRAALDAPSILEAVADCGFEIDEATSTLGAVVAVAELVSCHPAYWCEDWGSEGRCSPWALPDSWHWGLANVHPLPVPVPCRGALGLWNLPEDVERAVMAQQRSAA